MALFQMNLGQLVILVISLLSPSSYSGIEPLKFEDQLAGISFFMAWLSILSLLTTKS